MLPCFNEQKRDDSELNKTVKIIGRTALKRFVEILVVNILISAAIMLLNIIGILGTQKQIFHGMIAGTVLSIVINFVFMRRCYYVLTNRFLYYTSNYIAYAMFLAVNLFVGAVFDNYTYAWLFAVAKVARFSHYQVGSFVSALIFNMVMFLSVLLAPVSMGWVMTDEDYEY